MSVPEIGQSDQPDNWFAWWQINAHGWAGTKTVITTMLSYAGLAFWFSWQIVISGVFMTDPPEPSDDLLAPLGSLLILSLVIRMLLVVRRHSQLPIKSYAVGVLIFGNVALQLPLVFGASVAFDFQRLLVNIVMLWLTITLFLWGAPKYSTFNNEDLSP